jgi:hypothetical protein
VVKSETIEVDSLLLSRPRSVGVESVGRWAMAQLEFALLLERLGLNGPQRLAILGAIIARMAAPGSERATRRWLVETSGLGELLDVDFETLNLMRCYRASDALLHHRATIEQTLFARVSALFELAWTVTLDDLTNTFFEGAAAAKAKRGHSKEKRSDCPLLTLVLDASGFVRRSEVFAGNVVEGTTEEGAAFRSGRGGASRRAYPLSRERPGLGCDHGDHTRHRHRPYPAWVSATGAGVVRLHGRPEPSCGSTPLPLQLGRQNAGYDPLLVRHAREPASRDG